MSEEHSSAHRELREQLGAYALGGLPEDARARLLAHLDGCPTCRAELAEIAPLADALRLVQPEAVSEVPVPPADLGDRILARVAHERLLMQAHARRAERRAATSTRSRQLLAAAAAAVLVIAALAAGTAFGRATGPELTATPPAARLPIEDITLRALNQSVDVESAVVVAHAWGVEAKFEASGLDAGEVYRAAFRAEDGSLLPAGEFIGVGDKTLKCNMQAALLRDDTTGFVVTDENDRVILVADL